MTKNKQKKNRMFTGTSLKITKATVVLTVMDTTQSNPNEEIYG
jgi:hypothetical protein